MLRSLAAFGVRQYLPQTGFVLVFLRVLLVLSPSDRRRRPQHRPRRGLDRAGRAKLLELLLRHDCYLTTSGQLEAPRSLFTKLLLVTNLFVHL